MNQINELPENLQMHIFKYASHPLADLIKECKRCHEISIDKHLDFSKFYFLNRFEMDYDYLEAEMRRECYSDEGFCDEI